MQIVDEVLIMHLRNSEVLYDANRIESFLQALAAKEYYICSEAEDTTYSPLWGKWSAALNSGTDLPAPLHAGISEQAIADVTLFCSEKKDQLILHGFSVATDIFSSSKVRLFTGFEWRLGFIPEQAIVYIGYGRWHFTLRQDGWQAYELWLAIIQLIYHHWHPIYGYLSDAMGGERETAYEDILAKKITYLYFLNLLSPEIVEAIGRERIATVVAQRVIPLDDGGVMIIPIDNLLPDFYHYNYMRVAEHLGLKSPGLT